MYIHEQFSAIFSKFRTIATHEKIVGDEQLKFLNCIYNQQICTQFYQLVKLARDGYTALLKRDLYGKDIYVCVSLLKRDLYGKDIYVCVSYLVWLMFPLIIHTGASRLP